MNIQATPTAAGSDAPVRPDYVPVDDYISRDFLDLEARYLWPRTWQMACREEEIPGIGDYYTYDILDDSITVVRSGRDEIRAYHNVCPHRGRRLTGGCGHTARLHCRYHGWQWNLNGDNVVVVDRDDWGGALSDDDVALRPVKVGRWGGWVYINMDPEAESLEDALSPAKAILDPYDLGGLRYHWRKSTILPCNWKVALEAFNEGYHVQTTHRQMLEYMDDVTVSFAHGRHAMFAYWEALPPGSRSRRLTGGEGTEDIRPGLLAYTEDMAKTLNAGSSVQTVHAARRVMQEVPPGTPPLGVLQKFGEFIYEHSTSQGAQFPPITPEQMRAGGIDWHLFPNQIMLQGPTGLLGYRARPNGRDPDSCIWDVYSMQRYAPGAEPKVAVEFNADITDEAFWGRILIQDYQNMEDVQRGMRSRAFRAARPNPKQEVGVSNFHRALHDFIAQGRQAQVAA
jgi:phenylpropionate dioxygenase-like ring-hydroxylating dioxygenase large terminal subunit